MLVHVVMAQVRTTAVGVVMGVGTTVVVVVAVARVVWCWPVWLRNLPTGRLVLPSAMIHLRILWSPSLWPRHGLTGLLLRIPLLGRRILCRLVVPFRSAPARGRGIVVVVVKLGVIVRQAPCMADDMLAFCAHVGFALGSTCKIVISVDLSRPFNQIDAIFSEFSQILGTLS